MDLVEKLNEYFTTTPLEEIKKTWEATKKYDDINSHSAEEFLLNIVSQRSGLVADQDSLNFKLWQEKRGFEKIGTDLYKWNGLTFKREFVLEKYLEYKNKATCG